MEDFKREVLEEIALEELEEQREEQKKKIAAFQHEMQAYVNEFEIWGRAVDYGAHGIYARKDVLDQIEEKRSALRKEYDL